MSELKATPGPWFIYGDWAIKDSNGRVIGQFEPLNDDLSCGNTAESFANGYMMAASCAMYDALEVFAACADELDATKDTEMTPDDEWAKFRLLASDYRKARTALAKARGELP